MTPVLARIGLAGQLVLIVGFAANSPDNVDGPFAVVVHEGGHLGWYPVSALYIERPNGDYPLGIGSWSLAQDREAVTA